jgi:hypothetical protein
MVLLETKYNLSFTLENANGTSNICLAKETEHIPERPKSPKKRKNANSWRLKGI